MQSMQASPAQVSLPNGAAGSVIQAQVPAGSCHEYAGTHAGAADEVADDLHQNRGDL